MTTDFALRPHVQTGLDRLLASSRRLETLRGARVGLLANPTSVTFELEHAVDALRRSGVEPVRLFGPEHGVRAQAQDMEAVDQDVDPVSGIETISLYGAELESLRPDPEHLEDLDVVLADLQDIGARYYTYAYTVGLMMEACGEADVSVWVLDRPNPLGGRTVEGNVVRADVRSFVGMQPLANRHAMTLGELARFFAQSGGWECDLEVVAMRGWRRQMWYDDTGLPWVMPSPNMPTLDTATVYPGQCLLEGTNVSEARGTTRPFELFGAPWIDPRALADRLARYDLPGVRFRVTSFRPMFQKHAGRSCHGLQLHVTDREQFESLATSYAIIGALLELCEEFDWRTEAYEFVDDELAIDLLIGDKERRRALEAGDDPVDVARAVDPLRDTFDERREACLLYE
ncbi:MAG: exo-beta-N-acetylmuramidase NamZ domain-containing protein [Persicimonas sp.]